MCEREESHDLRPVVAVVVVVVLGQPGDMKVLQLLRGVNGCWTCPPALTCCSSSASSDEVYAQKLKGKALSEELDLALNDMTTL